MSRRFASHFTSIYVWWNFRSPNIFRSSRCCVSREEKRKIQEGKVLIPAILVSAAGKALAGLLTISQLFKLLWVEDTWAERCIHWQTFQLETLRRPLIFFQLITMPWMNECLLSLIITLVILSLKVIKGWCKAIREAQMLWKLNVTQVFN